MKTLLILRHAKSSWDDPSLSDHQRPLNKRGQEAAPQMGRLIAALRLTPDRILSSTALRARQTADVVAQRCGYRGEIEFRQDLYLARPEMYIAVLRELPDDCRSAMVVGHNPGLEELLTKLTGVSEHLPTAALAQVELDIASWSELSVRTRGRLTELWRPKELEDA